MVERRETDRFEVEAKVAISTVGRFPDVTVSGLMQDISKTGAIVISPKDFQAGDMIRLSFEMLGGPLTLEGKVISSGMGQKAKIRFEEGTYALHIEWASLTDQDWERLVTALR